LQLIQLKINLRGTRAVEFTESFFVYYCSFFKDLSDRELEGFICKNAAARWFCGFDLTTKTPDHSVFGRVESRIGTSKLSKIFSLLFSS
jgi:hypothetical protein